MKKILSVFLVFLLSLSMIPAGGAVYAEDSGSGGGSGGGGGVSNITGITILNPPKLFYYVGESLHLGPFGDDDEDGLFVKLEFAQGDPEYVPYSGFESWGITTDPANGTELTADHDGKHIKVTVNDLEVFTEAPLIVTSVQEGAALDPETASFDKNPANQEDVRVEVNWLENALELIKINYGENYFVSDEHYDFSTDDSSGKYYLTLKKELLDLLPVGQETFTLKFSRYISVELKVNIIDTTDPVLPPWPEGSTLTASSVTSESACLSWTAASEDYGVTEYKIYQNDTLIQTVDGKATACEITGLSPKTEYTFRVEAGNGSGQWTTDGPTVTVTTLSPPISNPPTWPEGSTLTVSSATYDTVNLSWTPAQDDVAVTGYKIYQDGTLIQTLGSSNTFEVTGLLPSTTYNFQVQAGDGDGQWTTDGPTVSVTTEPLAVPEIVELKLNAPRKNIKDSLYMGDTAKIELTSTETGLEPEVTVYYRELKSDRTNIEEKSSTVTLSETSSGSKRYTTDFPLTEGIWEIVSLEGKVPGSTPQKVEINSRVAGRLKAAVQPPAGLSSEEAKTYNQLLAASFATISTAKSGGRFTGQFKDGNIIIEGLDPALDYIFVHYDANYRSIYQSTAIDVKGGLETVLNYEIGAPSNIKVRVVDDNTGLPVKNAMVTGKATYANGIKTTRSSYTDENGYAAAEAPYFIKGALKGSQIEFTTTYYSRTNDGSDWYEDGSLQAEIAAVGDNEFEVRIKKAKMVTITGTVRNSDGVPLEDVYVSLAKGVYKDGRPIVRIYLSSKTDSNGVYTLQAAKIPDEIEVAFYKGNMEQKEKLLLKEGINTRDVTFSHNLTPTIKVILKTMDLSGNIGKAIIANNLVSLGIMGRSNLKIVNETTGSTRWTDDGTGYFSIPGEPGDTVEVSYDGERFGLGKGSATAVINENNYAEVTVFLKEMGSICANVTDQTGSKRIGEKRYMYLFAADNGQYVSTGESSAPYISQSLPEGRYNIVLSWDRYGGQFHYSWWQNDSNCIRVENIEVKDGEISDLGTQVINYHISDLYFRYKAASGITPNSAAALPGRVVTLRVVYDYDRDRVITPGKLDLVAQIPLGATYVEGSAVHRMTRGNTTANPVIDESAGAITLDLKDSIEGAAGTLTYQVRVSTPAIYDKMCASAELRFTAWGTQRSEMFGSFEIPTKMITLDSPLDIDKYLMGNPVKFSGLAPANNIVELYDGNIKIGEAQATQTGQWSASLLLPDMGAPAFHHIMAKTMADGVEYFDRDLILVGVEGVYMTEFTLGQGNNAIKIDPNGSPKFPFAISGQGDFLAGVSFSDNERVRNVKILGCDATRQGNEFRALVPYSMSTSSEIIVDYEEELIEPEDISKFIHDLVPPSVKEAEAEFVEEGTTIDDVHLEYGADGYIRALDIPRFKLTMQDGSITAGMTLEPVTFDTSKAKNRTNLGNGLYGYDFSYEFIDGRYVITAYLDRRLFPQPADYQAGQMRLLAASAGLETVKAVLDVVSDGNDLLGAYGDLSTSAQMANLMAKYESVRPNLAPHLAEYYDGQIAMMGENILMGKSLGSIGSIVAEAGNLVPLLGQVVVGAADLISGKLLGDMFDNEFTSDYNRLMTEFRSLPGGEEEYEEGNEKPIWASHTKPMDSYWYWYWYIYQRDKWYDYDGEDDNNGYPPGSRRPGRKPLRPHWIYDPSGFVYEGVEDDRIEGVTATALFLPKEAAPDAASAKASDGWQFWDAEWYLQENPQTTNAEGRYAWDVPEGWWMVQYVKEGYQTAYSDALPVPPPQLDVNIPMVKLEKPAVEKTVWGSGGRYVDVYFSKYMDIRSLDEANSVSLAVYADGSGSTVPVTAEYPVPVKTGVGGLSLTKVARFIPDAPLTVGGQYTLIVNKAVADYAGFSMTDDYTGLGTVPAAALIGNLTASDITVEPGKDITRDVMDTLIFTADNPGEEGMLDKRAVLQSSNANLVWISDDGKVFSMGEGTVQITATAVDDVSKKADFTVKAAYPPRPVIVSHMVIADKDGKALTDLSIQKGSTYNLTPAISPANATNKNMSYWSDNPAVASVDQNGRIQALTVGIALITAKTADKNIRQTIHVTVTAAAPVNPGNGGGGGGGGGGGNTPTTPAYNADVKAGSGSESILPVTVNKDSGSASINISAQSGLVSDGTVITIPSIPGVDTYSVGIPVADLSTTDGQGALILNTDAGSITVPSNMLTGVVSISGSKAEISIGKGDKSNLPEDVRDAIGDKPLIRLALSIDGRQTDWSNPNEPVTVSIPYTPTAAELANPESIVIWYIDGSGNVITIPNGRYDAATGTVTFNTTHFSDYAVAYNKVSFNDVPAGAWYAPAVSFIAAREITTGTGNGKYSPDAQLSRGEFIVLMMRAYGIAPDTSPADNFSDAGNTYYTGYLAAAKRLGITAGAGNNMYAPSKEITRQEMFTLLYNALKVIGQLPQGDSGKTLSDFSDAGQIDSWAKEAMTLLVKTGTIGGNAGKLNPTSTTTRAEMAQVLYNLLSK